MDFFLSKKQDKQAAKRFFRKSLKKPSNPEPEKITTDAHQAYPWAIKDLKRSKRLKEKVLHQTSKYLNNRIESDHARLKQKLKPMRGFKTFKSATNTIAGYGGFALLKIRQFIEMDQYKAEVDFVHSLFGLTA